MAKKLEREITGWIVRQKERLDEMHEATLLLTHVKILVYGRSFTVIDTATGDVLIDSNRWYRGNPNPVPTKADAIIAVRRAIRYKTDGARRQMMEAELSWEKVEALMNDHHVDERALVMVEAIDLAHEEAESEDRERKYAAEDRRREKEEADYLAALVPGTRVAHRWRLKGPRGRVVRVEGESVYVRWDDGKTAEGEPIPGQSLRIIAEEAGVQP